MAGFQISFFHSLQHPSLPLLHSLSVLALLVMLPVGELVSVRPEFVPAWRHYLFSSLFILMDILQALIFMFWILHPAVKTRGWKGYLTDRDGDEILKIFPFKRWFITLLLLAVTFVSWTAVLFDTIQTEFTSVVSVALFWICRLGWVFQMFSFLYSCFLLWEISRRRVQSLDQYCRRFDASADILEWRQMAGLNPVIFDEYQLIRDSLKKDSQKFQYFLAFSGFSSVFGLVVAVNEIYNLARKSQFPWMVQFVPSTMVKFIGNFVYCIPTVIEISNMHNRLVENAATATARRAMKIRETHTELNRSVALNSCFSAGRPAGITVFGLTVDRYFVYTSLAASAITTVVFLGGTFFAR